MAEVTIHLHLAGRWLMEHGIGFGSELGWSTVLEVEDILRRSDLVKPGGPLQGVEFSVEVDHDRYRPVVVTCIDGESYPPPPIKSKPLDFAIEQAILNHTSVPDDAVAKHILWDVQTWLAKGGGMGDCTEYMQSLSVAMERALYDLNIRRP
jgi:hypothetical protein